MAEQALYRKYRSSDFNQVIGQDHVVQTLTSAISSGRLSHAYLFTGPRGVGKTSVARLLARSLNCTGDAKPCNACESCQAAINSSLDIIEMDAASNRSIDAVRDLREKVGLAPTRGQYKIYIIDEVHMLTNEAFNALLKTLEEPPAHAVFILATTEAHKVPETIVSRTQRFSFKPINTNDIATHLGAIAAAEGITITPEALSIIANISRGGFRDAIGFLDQVAANNDAPITPDIVRQLLGYSTPEEILELSQALASQDVKQALEIATRLETAGAQAGQVVLQLTDQWRTILMVAAKAQSPADEATKKLASSVTLPRIAEILECLIEVSRSPWPALAFEAALARLASPINTIPTPAPSPKTPSTRIASTAPAPTKTPTAKTPLAPNETPAASASQPTPPTDITNGNKINPSLWPKVLVLLKAENNSLCALLQMYPADFADDEVIIKPRFNFHRDLFLKPANRTVIEAAAAKVYGRPIKISAQVEESAKPKGARTNKVDPSAELVSSALEILGGEIIE